MTELLTRFPEIGQPTVRLGMRRIVVTPFPYLVFHRASGSEVIVHAVRHSARDPAALP